MGPKALKRGLAIAVLSVLATLAPVAGAGAAVYTVTPGASDVVDLDTGGAFDGTCDAGGSVCTLRAAIQTANSSASPGADLINVPAGVYPPLTIANTAGDENASVQGDLDITSNLDIVGTGGSATISGDTIPVDRIFDIPSGASAVRLANLTLTKGQAPSSTHGGAIKHEIGALLIENSAITNSVAPGANSRGAGIYSSGGSSLSLTDVTVSGNKAAEGLTGGQGGGVWTSSPITVNRSTISSNTASFGCVSVGCGSTGGGLTMFGAAAASLTNTTVSGNTAGAIGNGGGIAFISGGTPLSLLNSSLVGNQISMPNGFGGGNILIAGDARLENTIIANGNSPTAGAENCVIDTFGSFISLGHNLEARLGQGASQCGLSPGVNGDITAQDAMLDALAFNGGPPTHALMAGSPAINAGGPNGPATDERGIARPQGPVCDIGAYELDMAGAVPGSTCAGPPSNSPLPNAASVSLAPGALPGPGSGAKKCKRKKRKAAAKKKRCKKRKK